MTEEEIDREGFILHTVARVAAALSIFGSAWMACSILRNENKRGCARSRLLMGMSLCDICSSLAWMLGFIPAPSDATDLEGNPLEGGKGNQATCHLQSMLFRMTFGTLIYNSSLALFYVMTIKYGWRERQPRFRRMELVMHFLAIGVGIAMGVIANSIGGTQPYDGLYCCVAWDVGYLWLFWYGPIWITLIFATTAMAIVYFHVRKTEQNTMRFTSTYFASSLPQGTPDSSASSRPNNEVPSGATTQAGREPNSSEDNTVEETVQGEGNAQGEVTVQGEEDSAETSEACHSDVLVEEQESHPSNSVQGDQDPAETSEAFRFDVEEQESHPSNMRTVFRPQHLSKSRVPANKWKYTRKVAVQGIFYLAAFYLSYFIPAIIETVLYAAGLSYPFWLLALCYFFLPLHGFFNWIVYIRVDGQLCFRR